MTQPPFVILPQVVPDYISASAKYRPCFGLLVGAVEAKPLKTTLDRPAELR
jgi:hypothetical protein